MNVAFTIVAKNYLAFAITLAQSLKKSDPDLEFHILLVDQPNGLEQKYFDEYSIMLAQDLDIPGFKEMAFKYNVTEFSTALKPFVIDFLFQKNTVDKLIYLDPDIYVYSSLTVIYDLLNEHQVLITPHFLSMETVYSGVNPETEYLFSGIYNLGFIALKKSLKTLAFIDCWENILEKFCYGDRQESLHVDQKWIDFLPAFLTPDELLILRHTGLNIAYWNIHERVFIENDNKLMVKLSNISKEEELVFFHFSGLNPLNIYHNKQCPKIDIKNYPIWEKYIIQYSELVTSNNYQLFISLGYSYNQFENGENILPLYRRMFRKILEIDPDNLNRNPFAITSDYYKLLKENNLLVVNGSVDSKITQDNLDSSTTKLKYFNFILKFLMKLVGLKNYITILRFSQKYFRPENQIFLIKKYRKQTESNYFSAND